MAQKRRGRTVGDVAGDIGVSAAKGAIGAGEAVMGLADLLTHGIAGRGWRGMGYDPETARRYLNTLYSAPQRAANQAVEDARGIYGTTAAMAQNPSTMLHTGIEATPQALMAGGIGRGLAPHLAKALPAGAAAAAPGIAGGVGEGILGMGQAAERIARNNPEAVASNWGGAQAMEAAAHGVVDAAIGRAGNKLVGRTRLPDFDTSLAQPGRARQFVSGVGASVSEAGPENYMQQGKDAVVARLGGPAPGERKKAKRHAINADLLGM